MSRGINKVFILGRVGDVKNHGTVVNVSVATNQEYTQNGQKMKLTEWHKIVFFGKLAEIAGRYLQKGSQVHVEGSLRTEKYTDKNGHEQYSTKIVAKTLELLDKKEGGGAHPPPLDSYANDPNAYQRAKETGYPTSVTGQSYQPRTTFDSETSLGNDDLDDIPF